MIVQQVHYRSSTRRASRAVGNAGSAWDRIASSGRPVTPIFGPLVPWDTAASSATLKDWDANKDVWEVYDLRSDFTQADDLAAREPKRLDEMQALFLKEAKANKVLPVGASLWTRFHPEDRVKTPYSSWTFDTTTSTGII